jgi:hypothetical protein
MIENPRYKNLYFHITPKPITVKKTTAMGPTEICESTKRRAKNKVARKTRRINKKNRRK